MTTVFTDHVATFLLVGVNDRRLQNASKEDCAAIAVLVNDGTGRSIASLWVRHKFELTYTARRLRLRRPPRGWFGETLAKRLGLVA
jgi:hypothetical protein